jgi:hypothetical protein
MDEAARAAAHSAAAVLQHIACRARLLYQSSPGVRADDAVRWKAVRFLSLLDCLLGRAPEDAVHGHAKKLLQISGILFVFPSTVVELGGTVLGGTPAAFGTISSEATEKWAKVIKFAGIKTE